ncbi:MAG: DUF308 domain-containing protein [Sphaerochaetaceae bacterium]|nr:DUF308 domain-containing protein [Sphaerochaetaceae bacterium]
MTVNVKKSWLMTALFGLLIAVLGILMIAYSSSAWKILIVLVGLGFVINAFFDISTIKLSPIVFKKWAISNTVLNMLLGVLMIILPWFVSTIISWVIGTLLIIYGIGMISEVCVFRPQYLLTRMIIVSLLAIAFGVLFIFDPSSFSTTVMLVIGIPCIVVGVMLLVGSIIYRVKKGKVQDGHIFSDDAPTYEQTATIISEEENSTESPSSDNS